MANENKTISQLDEATTALDDDLTVIVRKNDQAVTENYKIRRGVLKTTDYNELKNNIPVVNTNNTNSLPINSNEQLKGTLSLHKVAKTGDAKDLKNLPTKIADLDDGASIITNLETKIDTEINRAIDNEDNLQQQITSEVSTRESQVDTISSNIKVINNILDGVDVIKLEGAFLSRDVVTPGITTIARNLFPTTALFVVDKTLIHDTVGTLGKYVGDVDSATINVETLTISPNTNETVGHGSVQTHVDLPLTIADATTLGWVTPKVDDYAVVISDETKDGNSWEWYITEIDTNENITWGNERPINASDYQEQTSADWAGKVPIAGSIAGRWGTPLGIDTVPIKGSNNLINSNAVSDLISKKADSVGAKTQSIGASGNRYFKLAEIEIANKNTSADKTLLITETESTSYTALVSWKVRTNDNLTGLVNHVLEINFLSKRNSHILHSLVTSVSENNIVIELWIQSDNSWRTFSVQTIGDNSNGVGQTFNLTAENRVVQASLPNYVSKLIGVNRANVASYDHWNNFMNTTPSSISNVCTSMPDNSYLQMSITDADMWLDNKPISSGTLQIWRINNGRVVINYSSAFQAMLTSFYRATWREDTGFSGWSPDSEIMSYRIPNATQANAQYVKIANIQQRSDITTDFQFMVAGTGTISARANGLLIGRASNRTEYGIYVEQAELLRAKNSITLGELGYVKESNNSITIYYKTARYEPARFIHLLNEPNSAVTMIMSASNTAPTGYITANKEYPSIRSFGHSGSAATGNNWFKIATIKIKAFWVRAEFKFDIDDIENDNIRRTCYLRLYTVGAVSVGKRLSHRKNSATDQLLELAFQVRRVAQDESSETVEVWIQGKNNTSPIVTVYKELTNNINALEVIWHEGATNAASPTTADQVANSVEIKDNYLFTPSSSKTNLTFTENELIQYTYFMCNLSVNATINASAWPSGLIGTRTIRIKNTGGSAITISRTIAANNYGSFTTINIGAGEIILIDISYNGTELLFAYRNNFSYNSNG